MRRSAYCAILGCVLTGISPVAGCGGTSPGVAADTDQTTPTRATSARAPARTDTPQPSRRSQRAQPTLRKCDANILVNRSTTCPFAQNVFYAVWLADQDPTAFPDGLYAFSPTVGASFQLQCDRGSVVVCKTPQGALVRFRASALAAYSGADAASFVERADLGDMPDPFSSPEAGDGVSGGSEVETAPRASDCDPNYAGDCLDPSVSDYDCLGGSGNGPEYTGKVQVVGIDHYGLDRDGDGVGCE